MAEIKPGETIHPQTVPPEQTAAQPKPEKQPQAELPPQNPPKQQLPEEQPTEEPAAPSWEFSESDPETSNTSQPANPSPPPEVTWTASEFIAHEKTIGWYATLGLVTIGLALLAYLITKDEVTTGVVVFMGLLFGIVASRKPRTLTYSITNDGVVIGEKLYDYQVLKSFSLVQEGAIKSVSLLPLRRFMPTISLYYPPEQEQDVLEALEAYLPREDHAGDAVDKLMRKIRF